MKYDMNDWTADCCYKNRKLFECKIKVSSSNKRSGRLLFFWFYSQEGVYSKAVWISYFFILFLSDFSNISSQAQKWKWSGQKNREQMLSNSILYGNQRDNNKNSNQSDCLIQKLNLVPRPDPFHCFKTATEKLYKIWAGRPIPGDRLN